MKKLIMCLLIAACGVQMAFAQKSIDRDALKEARSEARSEQSALKKQLVMQPLAVPTPNPFNDTDSFGKNAQFLGSLYAGTVYVYHSCDPAILLNEAGVVLAADDHCVVKRSRYGYRHARRYLTTCGRSPFRKIRYNNVIYPMLNNGVFWENDGQTPGTSAVIQLYT